MRKVILCLSEIIFSITQTKLSDEVVVLAVCSSSLWLKDWMNPHFSCPACFSLCCLRPHCCRTKRSKIIPKCNNCFFLHSSYTIQSSSKEDMGSSEHHNTRKKLMNTASPKEESTKHYNCNTFLEP